MSEELYKARIKRIQQWVEDSYNTWTPGSKTLPKELDGEELAITINRQLFKWETGKDLFRGQKRKREQGLMGCWCFRNARGRQVLNIYRVTSKPYEQRSSFLEFEYKKE